MYIFIIHKNLKLSFFLPACLGTLLRDLRNSTKVKVRKHSCVEWYEFKGEDRQPHAVKTLRTKKRIRNMWNSKCCLAGGNSMTTIEKTNSMHVNKMLNTELC